MGHERVGALPHSKPWLDVVAQVASYSGSEGDVAAIAKSTIDNVRNQFRRVHRDEGVIAAFQFLVALSKAASPVWVHAIPVPLTSASTRTPRRSAW